MYQNWEDVPPRQWQFVELPCSCWLQLKLAGFLWIGFRDWLCISVVHKSVKIFPSDGVCAVGTTKIQEPPWSPPASSVMNIIIQLLPKFGFAHFKICSTFAGVDPECWNCAGLLNNCSTCQEHVIRSSNRTILNK